MKAAFRLCRNGQGGIFTHTSVPKPQKIKIMNEVLMQLQEIKQLALKGAENTAKMEKLALMGAKNVLNVEDLALLTGLSKSHIYKLVWAKKIPYYKNEGGKLTFFKKSEIEEWLCANRVPTMAEVEQQAIAYCVSSKK